MARRSRFSNCRRAFRLFLDFSLECMCLEGCCGRNTSASPERRHQKSSIEDDVEEIAPSYVTLERAQRPEAPRTETLSVGSTSEEEEGALPHVIVVKAMVHDAFDKDVPSLGSTIQEEDEEGALSNDSLERAQIEKASEEEPPLPGLRKAGTVAF